ncbi:MAG TPA: antitoxin family protein [Tepidisphaeraceae bacterium]|nr:antitoxin family protein [Tepidisphaeraceae bacterium]
MKTIRAIYTHGNLKPLDPVDLPENTPVRLAFLEGDDLPADAIAQLADHGQAFDFLKPAAEDLYSDKDGQAV